MFCRRRTGRVKLISLLGAVAQVISVGKFTDMSERNRDYYLHLRQRYEPNAITLAVVAESPPASGKYFYDASGSVKEPLFSALMHQIGISPSTKEIGLREFQRRGWVLIDATYQPVDKLAKDAAHDRDDMIVQDYPLLVDDLISLSPDRSIPVVLIKANVCRVLEPLLIRDRFNVLNNGKAIYFPSHGNQTEFRSQFRIVVGTK